MLTALTYADPLARLSKARFRMDFCLTYEEKESIRNDGIIKLMDDCEHIIARKLNDQFIDGRQTPFYGHPVFKAMHATACCCRKCLFKWHRIPPGRDLTLEDMEYIKGLVMRWIRKEMYK